MVYNTESRFLEYVIDRMTSVMVRRMEYMDTVRHIYVEKGQNFIKENVVK